MAGLGEACSHVAALMFFVENISHLKEDVSVTSVAPYWGTQTKKVPFAEVNNIKFDLHPKTNQGQPSKSTVPRLDETEFGKLCSTLRDAGSNSAILNVVKGFNNCDPNKHYLSNLFKDEFLKMNLEELKDRAKKVNIDITPAEARAINLETCGQASKRKWFLYRAGRITASVLKSAVTTKISSPAISTIKRICYPSRMAFQTQATSWGCKHEGTARKEYVKLQNTTHPTIQVATCGLVINPKYTHLGASPDGLVNCECCGLGCLEVKCPYCLRKREDKLENHQCLELVGKKRVLSKKHAYYYQIQCQLFITERKYCDFVLWKENDVHIERIFPDYEFWTEVSPKAQVFFEEVLLPEMLGKVFTQPCFPDGTDRMLQPKQPTIVFL